MRRWGFDGVIMETLIGLVIMLGLLAVWALGTQKVFKNLGAPIGWLFAVGLPALTILSAVAAKGKTSLLVAIPMIAWAYILARSLHKDKQARRVRHQIEKPKSRVRCKECGGFTTAISGRNSHCDVCGAPLRESQQ